MRLFGGRCACCGERAVATAPAGLEPGSLFGKSIEAIAVYLHYAQAIGIERLRCLFAEMFGCRSALSVSGNPTASRSKICGAAAFQLNFFAKC